MELLFFYLFSAILLFSAFMVIRVENPVHAVLYLVLVFCSNSFILLLLGTDFLALLLLVIYIGAIAILFLFVVMMLSIKEKKQRTVLQDLPIGFFIGFVLCLLILMFLNFEFYEMDWKEFFKGKNIHSLPFERTFYKLFMIREHEYALTQNDFELKPLTSIQLFGILLYNLYAHYVLIAGLILLLALLGAVSLTRRKKEAQRQQIYQQISRRVKNAVLKIKF
jgi:NADH-quinone oxidoreductase subunit J